MKRSFGIAAMLAIAVLSLIAFVPDASAAGLPIFSGASDPGFGHVVASAFAIRLATEKREALMTAATAKLAEIKAGMTADETRAIEQAHATMLREIDEIDRELVTLRAAPTPPSPTPAPQDGFGAVYAQCRTAKLTQEETDKVILEAKGDAGKAKDLIINLLADRDPAPATRPQITVTADSVDRFKKGAQLALQAKVGLAGEVNEFSGMTLRELARVSLSVRNVAPSHDPMQMIAAAFRPVMAGGMHSTSDFAEILANVANKSMLKGYEETEETFEQWTARGTLGDFKAVTRIDLNLFPSLSAVPEGGEYSFGTIGESAETIQLATYGKKFAITRQAIINDDLSVFSKIPSRMGRAARRTIGNLVYAVLTDNAALSDGVALFHADHTNLGTGGGSALSAASLDTARVAMAKQKDPDNRAVALNIRPKFLLVPVALGGTARVIMESQTNPDSESSTKPNKVRGLATIVEEARLDVASTTAWYLAGDPNLYDTVEVAYLNGNSTPVMEQQNGWDVDGVEYKIRIDAGVKALGHRALYKANGA